MKRALLLFGSLLLFCLFCATAVCQDTASIVGTVTDSSGAVIPNAKVTVSNPDKGFTRDLVSNSAGGYSISAVPIGSYTITAEAQGFEKLVRTGITLQVGQIQRVDLQLTVGQVTQEVSVTGNVVQVQTETAAISDVVTGNQISKLELNGRNWVSLALLVPGAVPANGLNTSTVGVAGNNNISFNGSRTQYNNWEIDGGNNTDEGSASTFNTYPNLDSIAEFRISMSNYGADLGKHAGATIELATKSGTKDFHGTASEYNRNSDYAANDFFNNRSNTAIPFLNQNEYGYTVGGPVYIPGHYNKDKSKTFFYWSEDWRSIRTANSVSSGVATQAMRQGDMSQCDPNSAAHTTYFNCASAVPTLKSTTLTDSKGNPIVYGPFDTIAQLDTFLESPAAATVPGGVQSAGALAQALTNGQDIINAEMPLPNQNAVTNPDGWYTASSSATNWRQEQIRVDQNISDKTQVFVRYTQDAWNTVSVPALWNWASYDTIKTPFQGPGKSAVLHITHSFTPSLMNEFIASYTTDHIVLTNLAADSVAGSINRPSGFVQPHMFGANDSNPLLPTAGTCINDPFCWYEDAGNRPWKNSNPIVVWKDNVSWIHGSHTTKMGFYLENYRKNEQFGTDTQGIDYFAGGSLTTGSGLMDMYSGRFQYYQEGSQAVAGVPVGGYPKGHWQSTDLEPYIQDDWKVNKNLTLNLGLRWYDYTRVHDVSRPTIDSGFIPTQYSLASAALLDNNGNIIPGTGDFWTNYGNGLVECGHGGIPNGCQKANTLLNFAPRFGFAWDPWGTGKTVIRGGYGMYFESGNGNESESEGGEGNPPSALGLTAYNVNGYAAIPQVVAGSTSVSYPTAGYTNWPYSQNWPYEEQFSLGVQRQLTNNDLITVSYVGNVGVDLARAVATNQVPDGLTTVAEPTSTGLAGYHNSDKSGLVKAGLLSTPSCDAAGNCNVQALLINQYQPSVFFVPYRDYSGITTKENSGHSTYHSLQVNYRHAFSHGLTFQTAYTWEHAIDNSTSTYEQNFQIDDTKLSRWKATSDNNRAQVLTLNYIYDLPFFKSSANHFAKGVLGGWSFSGISTFFTGTPIDFECAPPSGLSTGIGGTAKCNPTGPIKIQKGTFNDRSYGPTATWYNPANETLLNADQLLANGEPGMFGWEGRNQLTGPGRNNSDLALIKGFSLPWFNGEHSNLEFRVEAFNAFNHVSWAGVNTGCANNNNVDGTLAFGRSCGPFTQTDSKGNVTYYNYGTGEVNSDWGPRVVQLGLKFTF